MRPSCLRLPPIVLAALLLVVCAGQAWAALDLGPFEQDDTGNPFAGLTANIGTSPSPAVADLDGDGDLDVLLGHNPGGDLEGVVDYYRNDGTAQAANLVRQTGSANPLAAVSGNAEFKPALARLDNDTDYDLLLGRSDATLLYYTNTGTSASPVFTLQTGAADPFAALTVGTFPSPAFGDCSGDGLADVLVGDSEAHSYLRNTGTDAAPAFVEAAASSPLAGVSLEDFNGFAFGDLDDDGDLDLVVGSQTPAPELAGVLRFFENTGSPSAMDLVERTGAANPFAGFVGQGDAKPALADFDGDGDLDLLVGFSGGGIGYYRNEAIPAEGLRLTPARVAENQPVGTSAGTLSYVGGSEGASYSYSLVDGDCGADNALFAIDGDQLLTAARLDYEVAKRHELLVRSTQSPGGAISERCLTVTVTDLRDTPPLAVFSLLLR